MLAGCSSTPPPAVELPPILQQAARDMRAAERSAGQGDWAAALARWQAAADGYRLLNQLAQLATTLHNIGQAQQRLGHIAQATEALHRAAELNLLLNRKTEWWRNQIGLLQIEEDRSTHFAELLPRFPELNDASLAGHFLNELGLWQEQQNVREAQTTFLQAEEQFRLAQDVRGLAAALANQARLQERQGHYESAAELWSRSLAAFEAAGDPLGVTHALAGQGRSLAVSGADPPVAKELLSRAAANYRALQAHQHYTNTVEFLRRQGWTEIPQTDTPHSTLRTRH